MVHCRRLIKKTMNNLKKIISILIVVCCLVLSASFAVSATGGIPRVTFFNAEKASPILYITKKVTNVSDDYPAPDEDTFDFVLSLDGKPVNSIHYRVLDASGKEVEDTYSITGRSGEFSLKAGQTAVFEEGVASGISYTVTEESSGENYIQIKPVDGLAAVGTVGLKGTVVEFVNQYIPPAEDPTTKVTTLVVQNNISFPDNYTPWDVGDFTFTAEIGDKVLSNVPYTVTRTADGSLLDKRTTDGEGKFYLSGGQSAIFQNIKASADYKVEENGIPAGWRVVGKKLQVGATKEPVTVVPFSNVSVSFVVCKGMEDNTHPEMDFTFILTDENDDAWNGAKYYIYDVYYDTLVNDEIHETNADGSFRLRPDQAALFIEIEEGTGYNVKEVKEEGYNQILPAKPEGYVGKKVLNSVEELQFINRSLKQGGVLIVSKEVESMTNQPAPQEAFQFQIFRKNTDGEYKPVEGADYSIEVGTSQYTYRTQKNGEFSLQKDETAIFTALSRGDYRIIEISDNTGHYEPKEKEYVKKSDYIKEGTLRDDENLSFTFINLYWPVPHTGIKALSTVWKILIGIAIAILLAFAAVILIRRRKKRLVKQ